MTQDILLAEISGKLLENRTGIFGQKYHIFIRLKSYDETLEKYESELEKTLPLVRIRGPLRESPRLEDEYSPTLLTMSRTEHARVQNANVLSLAPCPLHHAANSASNNHSLRPRSSNSPRLNKPSLLITFNVRKIGDLTYETVISFPQPGDFEIEVTLANRVLSATHLKMEILHSIVQKKSCGDQQSPKSMSNFLTSSSHRTDPDDLVCKIGSRGRAKGQFSNPQDICTTSSGKILATDSNNQCVQVFNTSDHIQFSGLGRLPIQRGRILGHLQRPTGIAVLPEYDKFIIADYENRWISLYESKGKFVSRLGMGRLLGPKGIAADRLGKIYVVDNKASSVCVFQNDGRFLGRFGTRGVGEDQLAGPHFIGINSFGHAVVSDFHNHAVKVFDSTGQFLYSFGSKGEHNGQFNAPTGIALDSLDNIIVADWGNSRVQVFDRLGTFLQSIDRLSDPLYGPQGLSLNPDGSLLYVADSGNHCIKVLKYENCVTSVTQID